MPYDATAIRVHYAKRINLNMRINIDTMKVILYHYSV